MVLSWNVAALSSDVNQPIYIDSDSQQLDMNTNTVVFSGNVYLRQGSIRLNAQKIVVTRPEGKVNSETIDAYGYPATFSQLMDDGNTIKGQAYDLRYEVNRSMLIMSKKATLTQGEENKIEGQKITYNISKQLLVAEGDTKNRVTTVLNPQTQQTKSQKK